MKCKDPFPHPRLSHSRTRGITLIELMIVVTIIAALAAIAIPSYRNYNIRANRSAAAQVMLNIQNREEQYILDARTYTTDPSSTRLNIAHDGWTCVAAKCSNNFYDVSVALVTGPPPGYTVTGAPKGYQIDDGTLTLSSAGTRSRSAGDGKW